VTLVDFTDEELTALAAQLRRVTDPGREVDLHSAYGKAMHALNDPNAFKPPKPSWLEEIAGRIPDDVYPEDVILVMRGEHEDREYYGKPAQWVLLFCSRHMQPWQCLGLLHIAHEQTRVVSMDSVHVERS